MRAGVRARIADLARRAGEGAVSPNTVVALLSASAVAPVLAVAGAGAGATVIAATGVVGSVGSDVLAGVVSDALDRLRAGRSEDVHGADELDVAAVERALAGRIQEVLDADDDNAKALRQDIAAVLAEIGAARVAVEAAVEAGSAELRAHITDVLTALPQHFTEFGALLHEALDVVSGLQERLQQQESDRRGAAELSRQTLTHVRLLRDDLAGVRRHLITATATAGAAGSGSRSTAWAHRSPYRGLLSFREEHSEVFFGREQTTAEVVGRLAQRLAAPSVLIVTGPSGCGKSSLLAAGVLPAIARGMLGVAGSDQWPRVSILAGERPLDELAVGLAHVGGLNPDEVRHRLARSPDAAHLIVRQVVGRHQAGEQTDTGEGGRLVLVVDQFEQVFALEGGREAERAEASAFVAALMATATVTGGEADRPPALVILGVRGDHWERCAADPRLSRVLQDNQFVVGPMSRRELRRAISGPAAVAGLEIEDGLVGHVLDELDLGQPTLRAAVAVLPLLSQAMLSTWFHRDASRLTWAGYAASGGAGRAVQVSADEAYGELTPDQQSLARRLLLRLTAVTREAGVIRRRATTEELLDVVPSAADDDVAAALDAFVERRLLVRDGATVEIAHDVLLDAWPRLRGWLRESRDDLLRYNRLAESASTWLAEGRDPSYLYRGAELEATRELEASWDSSGGRFPDIDPVAREFLGMSLGAARRRSWRRRVAASGLAAITVLAAVLGSLFVYQRRVTGDREAESTSRELAALSARLAGSDPSLSMHLALAAYERSPTAEAERAMFRHYVTYQPVDVVLSGAPGDIVQADANSDGAVVAAVSEGSVTLWTREPGRPTERRPLHTGSDRPPRAIGVDVSDDGRYVVVIAVDHVALYDTSSGDRVWEVPFTPGELVNTTQVAIGDGGVVALRRIANDAPARFELWEPGDRGPNLAAELSFTIDVTPPSIVGFGPDPHTVVIDQGLWDDQGERLGSVVNLWDTRSGTAEPLPMEDRMTRALGMTEDGDVLVCRDGDTMQWLVLDVRDGTAGPVVDVGTADSTISCFDVLALDADAAVVVGRSTDEELNSYDWAVDRRTGEVVVQPELQLDGFAATAPPLISDGDRRLRVLVTDSAIHLVEVESRVRTSDIRWASVSPDGSLVVASVRDGSLVTIDANRVEEGQPLPTARHAMPVVARVDRSAADDLDEAFATNHRDGLVAGLSAEGRIAVWQLPDLEQVATFDSAVASEAAGDAVISWASGDVAVTAGPRGEWLDPRTGETQYELDLVELGVVDEDEDVHLAPSSSPEVALYWDRDESDIHSLEVGTGLTTTLTAGLAPSATRFQASANQLAILSLDGQLEVWDLDREEVVVGPLAAGTTGEPGTLPDPFVAQFLAEPGTFFVGADGWLTWYYTDSSVPVRTLELGETLAPEAVSSTGNTLLYRHFSGLDGETAELVGDKPWSDAVYALDLRPEAWRERLCGLVDGRSFTEAERSLYLVPASGPCP